MKTHKVIDIALDEKIVYVGTFDECVQFMEEENEPTYDCFFLTEEELKIHNQN